MTPSLPRLPTTRSTTAFTTPTTSVASSTVKPDTEDEHNYVIDEPHTTTIKTGVLHPTNSPTNTLTSTPRAGFKTETKKHVVSLTTPTTTTTTTTTKKPDKTRTTTTAFFLNTENSIEKDVKNVHGTDDTSENKQLGGKLENSEDEQKSLGRVTSHHGKSRGLSRPTLAVICAAITIVVVVVAILAAILVSLMRNIAWFAVTS